MDKGEKDAWKAKDPVPAFRKWLIASKIATEEELSELEDVIETEIDEAVEFAVNSPYPDVEELKRDVFEEELT
jgi:pyruvate dehydrogenase E1 component alpha subunit